MSYKKLDDRVLLEHLRQLTPDEQLTYVIEQGKQVNLFSPDIVQAQAQRFLQIYKTNAAQCYHPQLYHGKIIRLQATEKTGDILKKPDYGWKDYATEGVEIIQVTGNH
jgi:hypothetical protein